MNLDNYSNISCMKKVQFTDGLPVCCFITSINNIPIHMHDMPEMVLVLKGTLDVKISFNTYELKQGDFLLINSFELHAFSTQSNDNLVMVMMAEGKKFQGTLFAFDAYFYKNFNANKVNEIKNLMVNIYRKLERQWDYGEIEHMVSQAAAICDNYFQMQSYDVENKDKSSFADHALNSQRLKQTYQLLYDFYYQKITLADIANKEYLDKYYMSRLIKEGMGNSFQDTLNIIRVDRAEVLLLGTQTPIEELSQSLGFSSVNYFRKLFKLHYGLAPAAYRKKQQSNLYPSAPMEHRVAAQGNPEVNLYLNKTIQQTAAQSRRPDQEEEILAIFDYAMHLVKQIDFEPVSGDERKLVLKQGGLSITIESSGKGMKATVEELACPQV